MGRHRRYFSTGHRLRIKPGFVAKADRARAPCVGFLFRCYSDPVRERICDGLGFLGIELDRERNAKNAPLVSSDTFRVKVRVIRTDQELMIARSVAHLLAHSSRPERWRDE